MAAPLTELVTPTDAAADWDDDNNEGCCCWADEDGKADGGAADDGTTLARGQKFFKKDD